ncbi:hypothetical protein SMQE08_06560 [Serratia marcescens]|jgi:hypothetical protein|uniref:Lysozyme n=1 Tax=Serratia surfactantfaciens TaxID=2741499 RepID=A0ABS0LUX3_9GAMM|nr:MULTISPECIES: hypothetical protein [Serratia]WMW62712.1 hypothetical protein RE680_06540 [Serratia marcescens]AOE98378.1 hypothetical protein ATE40_003545 [Serratia surfactantfaciens]MBH1919138.1 hypothetical protein [Serratia surfactantfaciens]MTD06655.1 hypothetical protein [Serratia sp. YC16]BEM86196.1 hypothetical protein SME46J_06660 [Serratia marcescens]
MKKTILTGVIAATLGLFNTANAEGMDPAALKNVYDITRNTSGLMSYCVDKGFLKADSIDNAKKMVAYVAAIPGGVDTRDGDKREAMGREGNVLNDDGKVVALEKEAPQGLQAWCQQADEGIRQGLTSIGQ